MFIIEAVYGEWLPDKGWFMYRKGASDNWGGTCSLLPFSIHTFTGVVFKLGLMHYDIRQTAYRYSHLPGSPVSGHKNFLGGYSDLGLTGRKPFPVYKVKNYCFLTFGLLAWDFNDGQICLFYKDYVVYIVYTEYIFSEIGDEKTLETV